MCTQSWVSQRERLDLQEVIKKSVLAEIQAALVQTDFSLSLSLFLTFCPPFSFQVCLGYLMGQRFNLLFELFCTFQTMEGNKRSRWISSFMRPIDSYYKQLRQESCRLNIWEIVRVQYL